MPPCCSRCCLIVRSFLLALLRDWGSSRLRLAQWSRAGVSNDDDVFGGAGENSLHLGEPTQGLARKNPSAAHERKITLFHCSAPLTASLAAATRMMSAAASRCVA